MEIAEDCIPRILTAIEDPTIFLMTVDSIDDYVYKGPIQTFGFLSNRPSTEWILGKAIDSLIEGVHEKVWRQSTAKFNDTEYNQSLGALLSFASQVKSCGLSIRKHQEDKESNLEISDAIKYKVARIEHERWCRESLSSGKHWGEKREGNQRPSLVNFDSSYLKEYDTNGKRNPDDSIHAHNINQVKRWVDLLKEQKLTLSSKNES
jgi:hypothetical protein